MRDAYYYYYRATNSRILNNSGGREEEEPLLLLRTFSEPRSKLARVKRLHVYLLRKKSEAREFHRLENT